MLSVLLVGLDNAGKSTLLAHAKTPPANGFFEIYPTAGFSIERINTPRGEAIVYDCSGAPRYRDVWDYFCGEVQGVIYVIDSADRVRLSTVKANIAEFIKHPLLRRKPFVFLANKQDLQTALPKEELKRLCALDKKHISNPFSLKAAVAVNGMGFNDAITFIETNSTR